MMRRRVNGARVLWLLLILVLGAGSARAAGLPGVYVVTGIAVDAAPKDGGSARDAARAQGEIAAYRRLLERLTQPADWQHLPTLDLDAITKQLVDYEVLEEHSSAQRYLGDYLFRFNPKGARQILHNAGISYIELASPRVALVPLVRMTGSTDADLAMGAESWRRAWTRLSGDYGLVPWRVMPADLGAAFADPAAVPSPDSVATLSRRAEGGDVVVVAATPTLSNDQIHLDITVTRFHLDGSSETDQVTADGPKSGLAAWNAGVQAALVALENHWKADEAAGGVGTETSIEVVVPLSAESDWGMVSRRLAQIVLVHGTSIESMTRREVRLIMTADASPQMLQSAFAQQNLDFTPGNPIAILSLKDAGGH